VEEKPMIRTVLIVALWAAMAVAFVAVAVASPAVSVEPDYAEVWTSGDVWVDIVVNEDVTGLTGYDLLIDFDESVVEVASVVEGELPESSGNSFFFWTTDHESSDAVEINGAVLGASVDGPGVLARLLFHGLVEGVSPVAFLDFELRDLGNHTIPAEAFGGLVQVSDPPAIYLTPQFTEVYEGATFSIDVCVNGSVEGLTGHNLTLTLGPDCVRFLDAAEGPLPSSGGADTYFFRSIEGASAETLVINGAVLGDSIDGPGVLATIELFARLPGTVPLEFLSVDLRDIYNNALDVLSQDAVIVVLPGGSATEQRSWGSLKAMFR
jgi:hypothetical protein